MTSCGGSGQHDTESVSCNHPEPESSAANSRHHASATPFLREDWSFSGVCSAKCLNITNEWRSDRGWSQVRGRGGQLLFYRLIQIDVLLMTIWSRIDIWPSELDKYHLYCHHTLVSAGKQRCILRTEIIFWGTILTTKNIIIHCLSIAHYIVQNIIYCQNII